LCAIPACSRRHFECLWGSLKSGKPWVGIVMNRCKDGDHRWLVACVMRIQRDGANVECQSVRFKGDKSWVERAEAIDKRLARSSGPPSPRGWPSATG